jgi:hypothetical protein
MLDPQTAVGTQKIENARIMDGVPFSAQRMLIKLCRNTSTGVPTGGFETPTGVM